MAQMFKYQEKPGGKKKPQPAATGGSPPLSPEARRMAAEAAKSQVARDSSFKKATSGDVVEAGDELNPIFIHKPDTTKQAPYIPSGTSSSSGEAQQILPPDKTRVPATRSMSNKAWMRRYDSQIAKNGHVFVRHSDGSWYRHDAKGKTKVPDSQVPDSPDLLHTNAAKEPSVLDTW